MSTTLPGGASGTGPGKSLRQAEQQAAQKALDKLRSGNVPGSRTTSTIGTLGSATAAGGLSHKTASLALMRGEGSDTFMGGVRGSTHTVGAGTGTDTVVSGSAKATGALPSAAETLHGHGPENFSLSSDTINVRGATALGVKADETRARTSVHTVTLSDKTTINIAGLSANDISKLHH